jgi:hypothetical protein
MLYEIVNPSDPYTFEAPTFEIAAVAIVLLAEGQLGVKPVGDDPEDARELPLLLFDSDGKWFEENLFPLEKIGDFLDKHSEEIAAALDSVVIGGELDRSLFLTALARQEDDTKEAYRVAWHNKKRSSINDIGRSAWEMAKGIRETAAGKNEEAEE